MSIKERAWWFEPENGLLNYEDNRVPRPGTTHAVDGAPVLCQWGLHASKNPLHALVHAHSTKVWRVELGGEIVHGADKCAATERTYLWRLDAEDVLRRFARFCALDVAKLWEAPDVVVKYLKTGDESLREAARCAAREAALDGEREDTRCAARATAHAARNAARAAVEAARAAVEAARATPGPVHAAWAARNAERAARDAERGKQSSRLHRMLMEAHRKDEG